MPRATKAIKGVITNEKGEILLLQRNPKTRLAANWDLPGGLQEESESEKETLTRETKEELNVDIEIIAKSKPWKFFRPGDGKWVTVQNYDCKIKKGEILLSDEHINYRWVKRGEVGNYPIKDLSLVVALE